MVYHLTFENMNQLLKHQIMSPSELSHATTITHVLPTTITRPSSGLSENNILMQCMQKLAGQYPPPMSVDPRVVLQESNGQMMSTSSAKGELGGADDQHGGAAGTGCTPRPRWCPTPEQIQVLEALFNSGTTTPSRDMIVEIAGCLKQFGSIVEANVFYWFQNRKARAKRKLRMQQAQLQQQASTSPTHSNDCSSSQNGKSSATSRRVCAKTSHKTSPGAEHYQLSPLVHLPVAPHHSDHYHPNPLATAAYGGIMTPHSTLQVFNHASSCKMVSSSNADYPSCALSNTCPSQTPNNKHGHNHVISITSEPPPPFADRLESTNHPQLHTECDPYSNHISCVNAQNTHLPPIASVASSRPESAGSSDAIVGTSCSPTIAEESGAANIPHIFQTPHAKISTFLAPSTDQPHLYTTPAADCYSNHALTTGSTALYHVDRSAGSMLTLPSKRSWMDALLQEFVSTEPTHINNTSAPSNIMHNVYDMNYQSKAQTNEMLNINHDQINHTPIDLNLFLQRPQINPSQDSLINSTSSFSRLDCNMVPASQLNFLIKEENRSANVTQLSRDHLLTSSPSQAFHHELHGQNSNRSRGPENLESLMSSSSIASQQQQSNNMAFSPSSPKVVHHCDNLPLWEALAPYMSIGS